MEQWEQYEIWAPGSSESRWQLVAAFHDFDIASAVAKARGSHVRLIHAKYVDGKLAEQQVILDLGKTRQTA
jgi:1,2-phenylacetyl-CoA epoxidase PaaB subunit